VRSREVDRKLFDEVQAALPGYRMPLKNSDVGAVYFAPMRTFQSDIALRNLENTNW
jgi:hypothetical protein